MVVVVLATVKVSQVRTAQKRSTTHRHKQMLLLLPPRLSLVLGPRGTEHQVLKVMAGQEAMGYFAIWVK